MSRPGTRRRVLLVGDLVDDIGVRPLEPVTPASDTRAEVRMTLGGSAANVAAWLGDLGTQATFVGRAGTDGVDRHVAALASYGVRALVEGDPEQPTATLVALLDEAGERTMYVDRAANRRLSGVPEEAWEDVGWLHLTGYTFFDPDTRPVALAAATRAEARGIPWSVDPSTVAFLREVGPATFLGWTAGARLLFPNAAEAAELALDDKRAVVTDGAQGVRVGGRRHDAHPATVVDTTGAGDAFCAGWLHGLLSEADPVYGGLAAAARCVATRGARPV